MDKSIPVPAPQGPGATGATHSGYGFPSDRCGLRVGPDRMDPGWPGMVTPSKTGVIADHGLISPFPGRVLKLPHFVNAVSRNREMRCFIACYYPVMRGTVQVGLAVGLGFSAAAADFSAWTDSTRVRFNTTSAGAGVSATVANFPVLVRLTAADFIFSEARSNGADLRFADSLGNPIPFEIERFDAAAKLAEIWVLPTSVKGNSQTQWIKMYWGNPSATSGSSGPSVFAAAGNFAGVWHLGEDGGTANGNYKDASGGGNHGTGIALSSASDVPGAVGQASQFSGGANQGITVPHSAALHPSSALTVEAWVRSTSQGPYKRFVNKAFTAVAMPYNEYSLEADVTGTHVTFSLTLAGTESGVIGTTAMTDGVWYHVVGSYDGISQKVYVNGVLENSLARSGTVSDYGQSLSIARYSLDNNSNFDGLVDEARISRAARSADWIKLAYANQKAGQKLISFEKFSGCAEVFQTPRDTTVSEGAMVSLAARTECASGYSWGAVSGPAPRILDPEVKTLQAIMPRIARDTVIVYRFSAQYGQGPRNGDVRITVREAIPDPVFTLPDLPTWSGADTLKVTPAISNLAALKAAGMPSLRYVWTFSGLEADSAVGPGWLGLMRPKAAGSLKIGLCMDNGGAALCKETSVTTSAPSTVLRKPPARSRAWRDGLGSHRDARGRALPMMGKTRAVR